MTQSERVMNKVANILGTKYKVDLDFNFNRKYTKVFNGQDKVDFQAFEELKGVVPCVFSMVTSTYAVAPFLSYNTTWQLLVWMPIDTRYQEYSYDDNGNETIETKEINDYPNVYEDLDKLRKTLSNTTIDFGDNIKGSMTFSEPYAPNPVADDTGASKRVVIEIRGQINLTDSSSRMGSDTHVMFGIQVEEESDPRYEEELQEYLFTVESRDKLPSTLDALFIKYGLEDFTDGDYCYIKNDQLRGKNWARLVLTHNGDYINYMYDLTYCRIEGVSNSQFASATDGASTQEQGYSYIETDGESIGNSFTLTYNDYIDSSNYIIGLFHDIVMGFTITDEQFQMPVLIYEEDKQPLSYDAMIDLGRSINGDISSSSTISITAQRIAE